MIWGRWRVSPTSGMRPVARSTMAPRTCAPASTTGARRAHHDDHQGDAVRHAERTEMARRVRGHALLLAEYQCRQGKGHDLHGHDGQHDPQDAPMRGAIRGCVQPGNRPRQVRHVGRHREVRKTGRRLDHLLVGPTVGAPSDVSRNKTLVDVGRFAVGDGRQGITPSRAIHVVPVACGHRLVPIRTDNFLPQRYGLRSARRWR